MRITENVRDEKKDVVIYITSIAAGLCFITLVIFFINKLFDSLASCCSSICGEKNEPVPKPGELKTSSNEKNANRRTKLYYEPLAPSPNMYNKHLSYSLDSLDSIKYAVFEIPGKVTSQPVQPLASEATSGYSTISTAESVDSSNDGHKVFFDEYIQPSEGELYRSHSRSHSMVDSEGMLNLDLYSRNSLIRKTQGCSTFGKVKFSLQYEDKSKKKLIMILQGLYGLQLQKYHDNITGMYISAVLLPERDYRFQSAIMQRAEDITLSDTFSFHSRPHNRDFESRTIQLTIYLVEKCSKESVYGGARLPLLSHEIYSQVPTDISIGVKYAPPNVEIGDAQILLSYSSESQKLNVLVKVLRFINSTMLENLTGVHVKAYLTNITGEKMGKKKTVSKRIHSKNVNIVEFEDHMAFRVSSEKFLLSTLKLSLHGKHKIMGKHMTLGKIRIGENSQDEAGKVHWKTVYSSECVGWTVWQPILNT